jgi:mannose-6-phosphate isomerase
MRAYKILGAVQHYDWGKLGSSSKVAQFYSKQTSTPIDETKPYAEIWFGTHVAAPSKIILENGSTELLSDHIQKDPAGILGEKVAKQWNNNLPFLFKILSINKALSIQAHPDKALAEELFKQYPQCYKDDNHKPEIACALTNMDALCEFRPCSEIAEFLKTVPELRTVIGQERCEEFEKSVQEKGDDKDALSKIFSVLMHADVNLVKEQLQHLIARLQDKSDRVSSMVKTIHEQFPGDVGVFCIYFLNLLTMSPGQGVFLAANEPHAYLKGDCIECMATSDNVVRAGLTPKFKDVDTLTKMLTFKSGLPSVYSDGADANVFVYSPPVNEFEIAKFVMYEHTQRQLEEIPGPTIMLVLSGKGRLMVPGQDPIELQEGVAVFTYANTNCYLVAHEGLTIYRASVNDKFY